MGCNGVRGEDESMSNSQMIGIRMLCVIMGWVFGTMLFGADVTWLWGMKSYIWCGMAGGCIGVLLTSK